MEERVLWGHRCGNTNRIAVVAEAAVAELAVDTFVELTFVEGSNNLGETPSQVRQTIQRTRQQRARLQRIDAIMQTGSSRGREGGKGMGREDFEPCLALRQAYPRGSLNLINLKHHSNKGVKPNPARRLVAGHTDSISSPLPVVRAYVRLFLAIVAPAIKTKKLSEKHGGSTGSGRDSRHSGRRRRPDGLGSRDQVANVG